MGWQRTARCWLVGSKPKNLVILLLSPTTISMMDTCSPVSNIRFIPRLEQELDDKACMRYDACRLPLESENPCETPFWRTEFISAANQIPNDSLFPALLTYLSTTPRDEKKWSYVSALRTPRTYH